MMESFDLDTRDTPPIDATNAPIVLGPGTFAPMPFYDNRSMEAEAQHGNLPFAVLHTVRRRWFSIAVLGLIAGMVTGTALWYFMETEYTATAKVYVPAHDESLMKYDSFAGKDYDLKRRTAVQLITSPAVLQSALARDEVLNLPVLRAVNMEDRVQWLASCTSVSFPNQAEVMELRVRCTDKAAAKTLVSALRQQFLDDQSRELKERLQQIDDLRSDLDKYENEFRREQGELTRLEELADPQSTPSAADLELAHQRQLLQKQRLDLEEQLWRQREQRVELEQFSDDTEVTISDEELEPYLNADQEVQRTKRQIVVLEKQMSEAPEKLSGKGLEDEIASYQSDIQQHKSLLAERTEAIRQNLGLARREKLFQQRDPAVLDRRISSIEERIKNVDEILSSTAPSVSAESGSGSVPATTILMQQDKVDTLKRRMAFIQQELDRAELAKVEDADRQEKFGVKPIGGPLVPAQEDERRKLLQSCAAGGAAFALMGGIIVLFDLRRCRLNNAAEVTNALQLPVLGTIPLLRGSGQSRIAQSAQLAEAVDSVAATLLCQTSSLQHRVVMICSAMPGEGKTTLAANLATSLTAAGRRTVLVDFDLRRPMLHQVYQVPSGPGVGELLLEGASADLDQCMQETVTEGLWLIPAGNRRQGALAALSDARVADIFEELKERFEFVIVDGPPVLPVVDTRLIARHADGVVMSMLRDVSELPKIKSACQLLQSYRVQILGGVVIGTNGEVYYGYPPQRVTVTA